MHASTTCELANNEVTIHVTGPGPHHIMLTPGSISQISLLSPLVSHIVCRAGGSLVLNMMYYSFDLSSSSRSPAHIHELSLQYTRFAVSACQVCLS
jgi:hypothetical protein